MSVFAGGRLVLGVAWAVAAVGVVSALLDGGRGREEDVIRYTVRLHEPQTQSAEVVVEIPGVAGDHVDVALPVWRPGRYALVEPSTTISHVRAAGDDDRPLAIEKQDKATWRVATAGARSVRLTYRVYANSLNDRTRHIDDTHAFLSPASVFMYVPERRADPLTVTVDAPAHWRTGTGLASTAPHTFAASDYDSLVDAPLEIGVHDLHTFEVDGTAHEIVIWHAGAAASAPAAYDPDALVRDFTAIIRSQAAIFGGMPYDRFVFMIHAGPGLSGGTEHFNSTIMQTSRAALEGSIDGGSAYRKFLGLVSHEMFHTWNVKRLRPADLRPYDYAHENYTRLLWVAEGATSYYDDLCLVRAGLMEPDEYITMVEQMIEGQSNVVGWDAQSLEESSFDAWVKFNKSWPDSVNTTVSFYSKGALVSMLLDLELRARTENRVSLDTVMRAMYERFPHDGPGFTTEEMLRTVNEVSGTAFDDFFRDYVAGTARPDFGSALGVVGLEGVSEPKSDEAFLGLNLVEREGRTVVASVLMNGPAYGAGLIADDEIVALDHRRLRAADLQGRVGGHQPGETLTFTVLRRDELRTVEVTLAGDPRLKWSVQRVDEPTDAQRGAYEEWLGRAWDE